MGTKNNAIKKAVQKLSAYKFDESQYIVINHNKKNDRKVNTSSRAGRNNKKEACVA